MHLAIRTTLSLTPSDIEQVHDRAPAGATSVDVTLGPTGYLDCYYHIPVPRFERIRRITGYLVGTVDRWNDAKKAELADRQPHGVFVPK